MKFKKEFLQELEETDLIVESNVTGTSRWSTHYRVVFKHEDKFYETRFSRGSTEMQDEYPYDHEPDEIECPEVVPVEKIIIVYEKVK